MEGRLWDGTFLQSIHSPFTGSEHIERRNSLIRKTKKKLRDWLDSRDDTNMDLFIRLTLVDSLVSLGIQRHFQSEINEAIQYCFRSWSDNKAGIGTGTASTEPDLNTTALAFMLLRLHRYPNISSEIFATFGSGASSEIFATFGSGEAAGQETGLYEEHKWGSNRVVTLLNLLRSSRIQFPGEFILQNVEKFCTQQLNEWLSSSSSSLQSKTVSNHLTQKVRYVLTYDWDSTCDRWNTRCFIDFYESEQEWQRCEENKLMLELAKLDYNILQAMFQRELKEISRWWTGFEVSRLNFYRDKRYLGRWWTGFEVSRLNFYRDRLVQFFFWPACGVYQEELQPVRSVVNKIAISATVLNDMYDVYATHRENKQVTEIVQRRDLSLLDSARDAIQISAKFIFEAMSQLAQECSEIQHGNMEPYLIQALQVVAEKYQEKRDWCEAKYSPGLQEYMKLAIPGTAILLHSLGAKLAASHGYPVKLLERELVTPCLLDVLISKSGRLRDDIAEALADETKGEVNAVHSYMKDHPECSLEEAAKRLMQENRETVRQATQLYLDPFADEEGEKGVPLVSVAARFEILRTLNLIHMRGDGFTVTDPHLRHIIELVLFDPVTI